MATHLDLEEQEQLDRLKHFWNMYGTLITWAALLIAGALVAWNGWQYYQRLQAARAGVLFDQLEQAVKAGDADRVQRAFDDIKTRFARTAYAQQAGLLAAKGLADKGKAEASRSALSWVAEHAVDPGYQAIARLRLASELMDAKSWDDALRQLGAGAPKEFEGLFADRRGDVYQAQGKREEARAEYQKAWAAMTDNAVYRRLIEVKLNAAGVDPKTLSSPATPAKANP